MGYEEFSAAMTNRSLRTVKAELEFLVENGALTYQQLNSILSQLPAETNASAAGTRTNGLANGVSNLSLNSRNNNRVSTNIHSNSDDYNEKQEYYNQPAATTTALNNPPPSYNATPTPQPPPPAAVSTINAPLTHAIALYAYAATDAGDLPLQPNDRIAVMEYMNADWWKGRSERTGAEGIFPRSYVRVEEKAAPSGIMPMDVAAAGGGAQGGQAQPNKLEEGGKKFGKKLGNAAIFGAGATIGSNLVNSIF